MKTIGLDGRERTWNLSKYVGKARRKVSKPHLEARKLLRKTFPAYQVLEEVSITTGHSYLYADFFIPQLMLMVEVHGEQHYQRIPLFHKTKADFIAGKKRDKQKAEWCELNDINLVVLDHKESLDEWREKILDSE